MVMSGKYLGSHYPEEGDDEIILDDEDDDWY